MNIKMMNKKIDLGQLRDLVASAAGSFDVVYLHWTAGHYGQHPGEYHLNIDEDGSLWQTLNFQDSPKATWRRNWRSLAITLDCCAGAALYADGSCSFGDEPPTDAQVECLAQVIATIADVTKRPIRKALYMTHAEAAELDEYGPNTTCERWDLWTLPGSMACGSGGDYIRGKAIYYLNQWQEEE